VIAFQRGHGIGVTRGAGPVAIRGNSIHDNAGLGIDLDLGVEGVTANDDDDADAFTQNFPRVAGVGTESTGTTLVGTLDSTPSTTFTLDFMTSAACDPSGNGEGEKPLVSQTVTTDDKGVTDFFFVLPVSLPDHTVVTATATSPDGDTSEFSNCKEAAPKPVPVAPGGLHAASVSVRAVALRWTDESIFEDGFRVERAERHGHSRLKFKSVGSAPRNATSFTDTRVKKKRTYVYRVVAFNRAGDSPPSGALTVTTPAKG
jgi:hypothetical protein